VKGERRGEDPSVFFNDPYLFYYTMKKIEQIYLHIFYEIKEIPPISSAIKFKIVGLIFLGCIFQVTTLLLLRPATFLM
jgi:hypothetical protein